MDYEQEQYKRFLKKVIVAVSSVLAGIVILNFVVDPFNMNGLINLELHKNNISYPANYRLFKMVAFTNRPVENILLGDSRTNRLDTQKIEMLTGEEYFNFAYGGGSIYEAIDTFWYAAQQKKLKNVYMGINFNIYNKSNKMNLVPEAQVLIKDPKQYYMSLFIAKVSLYNIIYKISGKKIMQETPQMTRNEFWARQLGIATQNFYGKYQYPDDVYGELKLIKQYCIANDINLVFLIPPTHVELQKKVVEYHLEQEYQKYMEDLASISETINFDYPNQWTEDKELFLDPYHFNNQVAEFMIYEIWTGNYKKGKIL